MPGDHHPLAFEGAVYQLRQLVLGLCNAMGAHKSNIAIRWPFCASSDAGNLRAKIERAGRCCFLKRIRTKLLASGSWCRNPPHPALHHCPGAELARDFRRVAHQEPGSGLNRNTNEFPSIHPMLLRTSESVTISVIDSIGDGSKPRLR